MPVVVPTIRSRILRDNPLRDPAERRIVVYLPPGHEAAGARYPVVYFLPGFSSRGTMLLNESAWDENLPERLDRLIRSGTVRPLILVSPDCMTRLGGSQYVNSTATGRYEDHIVEELVPFIDESYPTLPEREQRAIAGKSSGGYGASILAMHHPELFGLCADHSGDKYFDLCYRLDIPKCVAGLAPYSHSAANFLRGFPHPRPDRGPYWFSVVNMLAMASCYSPNPGSALGFDLPFDARTGELDEEVWQRWLAHDPVHLVARHADALRSLRLYFIDCGRHDEYHLQCGNRIYAGRLHARNVPHVYEEFEGGHAGTAHRYEVSLRALSAAFAPAA